MRNLSGERKNDINNIISLFRAYVNDSYYDDVVMIHAIVFYKVLPFYSFVKSDRILSSDVIDITLVAYIL